MANTLYYGDNLDVLRGKLRDETVDLCYIDPPFNSKRNYFQIYNNIGKDDVAQAQAFVDTWVWNQQAMDGLEEILLNFGGRYTEQTVELMKGLKAVLKDKNTLLAYLISMTQRVNEIWRVLKPTGSFYLHCDPTCSHYLKLVLDSVFCGGGRGGDFVNEIVWKRSDAKGDSGQGAKHFGRVNDVILFYSKSKDRVLNRHYIDLNPEYIERFYKYQDSDGKRYKLDNMLGPGGAAKGNPYYEVMGVSRYWRYSKERMQKLIEDGRVVQLKPGNVPMYKRYLDESKGTPLTTNWTDISLIRGWSSEKLGYPTQKPEALLERIIQASSNEGDTILDAYCGCGTTVAVAQKLKRKWIGIDITYASIAVILQRLEDNFDAKVIKLPDLNLDGIPKDMASARALAHKQDDRVRKEFEKWAVLTYANNRAAINDKKGADKGVDGVAYLKTGADTTEKIIFQVKSGKVQRNDIAVLNSDRQREGAEMAVFITLEEPTKAMREEAVSSGQYIQPFDQQPLPRIQIVTIEEMLNGERLKAPLVLDVLKRATPAGQGLQTDLGLN